MRKITPILLLITALIATSCTKKRDFSEKVYTQVHSAKVKGLDPVNAGDTYSSKETARAYETLLAFHYLKRPYTLIPRLAEAMPKVSKDGLTYTFKIKKGVVFQDNKVWTKTNGKGRGLVAEDFVYSIKRLADSKNNSTGWWLVDSRIVGLNEWRSKYKGKKANYSDAIEGVKALDAHTLQFKLTAPYPQFLYSMAMIYTAATPKEAVDFYGKEFLNNPVGTGAFQLEGSFRQTSRMTWIKNPTYRDEFYPTEGMPGDLEKGLLRDAGKKLPLVDKIKVVIQTEASTRFLEFENGNIDLLDIPKDNFDQIVLPGNKISEEYARKGMELIHLPDLDITYVAFNHDDPLFKKNKKLRQAMSMAYQHELSNKRFYNGTGVLANSILPPGIAGYNKNFVNKYTRYNIEEAKKLLAQAGYPNGSGLPEINYECTSSTVARQMAESFAISMSKIGIKIKISTNTWPQLTQKVKGRRAQLFAMAWLADYPDAENFLQLLWGPNSAPGPNGSNYNNPEFNKKFEIAKAMQPGAERAALYQELTEMIGEEVPLIFGVHRAKVVLKHGWVENYKFSTFDHGNAKYYSIDQKLKEKTIKSGVLHSRSKKTASN